jgi:hypothetical protein
MKKEIKREYSARWSYWVRNLSRWRWSEWGPMRMRSWWTSWQQLDEEQRISEQRRRPFGVSKRRRQPVGQITFAALGRFLGLSSATSVGEKQHSGLSYAKLLSQAAASQITTEDKALTSRINQFINLKIVTVEVCCILIWCGWISWSDCFCNATDTTLKPMFENLCDIRGPQAARKKS